MANNRIRRFLKEDAENARKCCDHSWPLVSHTATLVAGSDRKFALLDYHYDCILCGPHSEQIREPRRKNVKYTRGKIIELPDP